MKTEIVFLGKVSPRYRWKYIKYACKVLWNAFRGYHLSVHMEEPPKETHGRYLIESDGDSYNTHIYDENGNEITKQLNVSKIEWVCRAPDFATTTFTVTKPKVSLKIDKENVVYKNE